VSNFLLHSLTRSFRDVGEVAASSICTRRAFPETATFSHQIRALHAKLCSLTTFEDRMDAGVDENVGTFGFRLNAMALGRAVASESNV
jgi:hypothetical protein